MNRHLIGLVIGSSCLTVHAQQNALWPVSQNDLGGVGLMQTPTARMAADGEFNIGGTWNDDYYHYMTTLQLLPWLQTTIRYTRIPDLLYGSQAYSGDTIYTDKGIDVKLNLLDESFWLPQTSVGIQDIGGTGLFDGEYIAASKRFGSVDFTLGLGFAYFGTHADLRNPLCVVSDQFCHRDQTTSGRGGIIEFQRWFRGDVAWFGGVEYQTPWQPLRLKLEFEGNNYLDDFPNRHFKGRNTMPQDSRWNFGVNYWLGDWGDLRLSYERGNTFTAGFNLHTNFNDQKLIQRDVPMKPISEQPVTAPSTSNSGAHPADTDVVNWQQVAQEIESNAGYTDSEISVQTKQIIVRSRQIKYRDRQQALKRIAAILDTYAGPQVTSFIVIEKEHDMSIMETRIDRQKFRHNMLYASTTAEQQDTFVNYDPKTEITDGIQTFDDWSMGISPVLKNSIGAGETFYVYQAGFNGNAHYRLSNDLVLSGSLYLNVIDNFDKLKYDITNSASPHFNNEAVPRVRSMGRRYVSQNALRMNNLQLTWFSHPMNNLYTQAYAGYLETSFAGVGGEMMYRPLQSHWAFGIDINAVTQRHPDSWFGVYGDDYEYFDGVDPNTASCSQDPTSCRNYVLHRGMTGHLTTYYQPDWSFMKDTLIKVSAGQFLGQDRGVRVDVSRQFQSGITVGAYAVLTNLSSEEYGEGSFNKGFYCSLPVDLLSIKPTTSRVGLTWQPLVRDGGQMLSRAYQLYSLTDIRSPWYQRITK